jgi:hypothetical protein
MGLRLCRARHRAVSRPSDDGFAVAECRSKLAGALRERGECQG